MATETKTLMMLVEQTRHADGSVTVRPVAVADERDIGTGDAAKLLGFRDGETIHKMCRAGQLRAWKAASARGNAKWRISLQSVLDYKKRRCIEARFGRESEAL
jgi:hypothetical protein